MTSAFQPLVMTRSGVAISAANNNGTAGIYANARRHTHEEVWQQFVAIPGASDSNTSLALDEDSSFNDNDNDFFLFTLSSNAASTDLLLCSFILLNDGIDPAPVNCLVFETNTTSIYAKPSLDAREGTVVAFYGSDAFRVHYDTSTGTLDDKNTTSLYWRRYSSLDEITDVLLLSPTRVVFGFIGENENTTSVVMDINDYGLLAIVREFQGGDAPYALYRDPTSGQDFIYSGRGMTVFNPNSMDEDVIEIASPDNSSRCVRGDVAVDQQLGLVFFSNCNVPGDNLLDPAIYVYEVLDSPLKPEFVGYVPLSSLDSGSIYVAAADGIFSFIESPGNDTVTIESIANLFYDEPASTSSGASIRASSAMPLFLLTALLAGAIFR